MTAEASALTAPVESSRLNSDNPWPGLMPFQEADQKYFQGRGTETEALRRLVLRESVTLLVSLSGLGKSSLLQAGLFPSVRQDILPVYIRLDFSSVTRNLVAQVNQTDGYQAYEKQANDNRIRALDRSTNLEIPILTWQEFFFVEPRIVAHFSIMLRSVPPLCPAWCGKEIR